MGGHPEPAAVKAARKGTRTESWLLLAVPTTSRGPLMVKGVMTVKVIAPQCCVLFSSVRARYVCMRGGGCAHLLLVESKLTWTDEFASLLAAGSGLGSPEKSCGVSDVMMLCVEKRQAGRQDFHLAHQQDQYTTKGREDDGLPCGQRLTYKKLEGEGKGKGAEQIRRARVETSRSVTVTTRMCYQGGIYVFAPDPRAPRCAPGGGLAGLQQDAGADGNMQARAGAARRSAGCNSIAAPPPRTWLVQPPDSLTEQKPTVGGVALDRDGQQTRAVCYLLLVVAADHSTSAPSLPPERRGRGGLGCCARHPETGGLGSISRSMISHGLRLPGLGCRREGVMLAKRGVVRCQWE